MAKEDILDLEKAVGSAPDSQLPAMAAGGGEQELLPPDLGVEAEGVVVAAKMSPGLKNWRLPYWLVAGSVIFAMTNHIQAAPKYEYEQLLTPGLAMFTMLMLGVFLCANCMILRTM